MRVLIFIFTLFLFQSCSSNKTASSNEKEEKKVDFSKDKSISQSGFNDYFSSNLKNQELNFLFDETMNFSSKKELESLSQENKDIFLVSLSCKKNERNNFESLVNKFFNKYHKLPAFWNIVGNCHLNWNNFRTALLFYNKSLELDSNYAPTFNNLGIYYLKTGSPQKALVAFEKSHSLSNFSKTPAFNLAQLYLKYNLLSKSENLIKSLSSTFPGEVRVIRLQSYWYYASGDYKKAVSLFEEIIAKKKSLPLDHLYLSFSLLKEGSLLKAQNVLKTIESKNLSQQESLFFSFLKRKIEGSV